MENICSEIQLQYKRVTYGKVNTSKDAATFLQSVWNKEDLKIFESFKVLFLNQGNYIIGYRTISTGGISQTTVDVRLIMSIALGMLATGVILSHNHPSGNLNPSFADLRITEKIKEAGLLLDINVIDHIIYNSEDTYFSFAEEGRL